MVHKAPAQFPFAEVCSPEVTSTSFVVAIDAFLLALVVRAELRAREVLVGQSAFHVTQHGVVQEGVLLLKENSLWLEQ